MIDLELLKSRGCSDERLKLLFDPNCAPDPDKFDEVKEGRCKITAEDIARVHGESGLLSRIRSRVQEGMTRNLTDFQAYYALDLAWDSSFRQISPTLLQSLINEGDNSYPAGDDIFKKMSGLGLDKFVVSEKDKTGKETGKKYINAPAFFTIIVPLVKAYVTIRWAKIVNDRDQFPLFDFSPAYTTTFNKAKCEVLTNRVQVMSMQYAFFDVLKQAVRKMLHYGDCLQFVEEEWHYENQVQCRKATAEDVKNGVRTANGETAKEGDDIEVEIVSKEGLRYKLPHPTRAYRDLAYGKYTLNADCGSTFAGYWGIERYRELLNKGYWNTSKIKVGVKSPIAEYWPFFQTVYSACKLTIPVLGVGDGGGTTNTDAERKLADEFYGTDSWDKGVLVTRHFEKLIPSENGLGNYTNPVWFRFVVAGDGCTVLYAAPLPYTPVIYYGYDPDESRDKNDSMGLQVLPFQDHFTMMLSQTILAAKQNLANLTLANTDIIDEADLEKLRNTGEAIYRKINIIPRSFKKIAKILVGKKMESEDAFQSHTLPKQNVAELVNMLKAILDVLERIMQVSAQEMAQQASHEQSAQEVQQLNMNSSSRVVFTAKAVDIAIDAWKRQVYLALMAYGDKEFYAHIPADPPLSDEQLKKLGFTYDADSPYRKGDEYRKVKVDKSSVTHPLYEFASTVTDLNRRSDPKMAAALAQVILPLVQNPILSQKLGAKQIFDFATKIAHLAGVDRDFILRPVDDEAPPQQQKDQAQNQLKQILEVIDKRIDAKVSQDIMPLLKNVKESDAVISLLVQTLKLPPDLVKNALATVQNTPEKPDATPAPANPS